MTIAHSRERRHLYGEGKQREHQKRDDQAPAVEGVHVSVPEGDVREQVDGDPAKQREGRHDLQRVADVAERLLQPERDEDDPGDHRQVEVGVGVAGQLVLLLAGGASTSRRVATRATTSK